MTPIVPELNNNSIATNQLLAALPPEEYLRLAPYLETVSVSLGEVLYQPGEPIEEVYFPDQGLMSLLSVLPNGSTTEIAMVGREGMVGLPVMWGGNQSFHRVVVQLAGNGKKIDADILQQQFKQGGELQRQLLLYTKARYLNLSQIATCLANHPLEQRLARWLLSVQDLTEKDRFEFTQQQISKLLAVRRASISESAGTFQKLGLIRYVRGQITIIDREKLQEKACWCYDLMRRELKKFSRSSTT